MPAWRVLHLQGVQRARAMIEYQSTFWAPILYRCSPAAEHACASCAALSVMRRSLLPMLSHPGRGPDKAQRAIASARERVWRIAFTVKNHDASVGRHEGRTSVIFRPLRDAAIFKTRAPTGWPKGKLPLAVKEIQIGRAHV